MYIAAQILVFISIALLVYSSVRKLGRKTVVLFNVLINFFWGIHYLLLEAYSGAACAAICTVMITVFYFKGKTKFLSSYALPIVFSVVFIAFGLLTYQNIFSIIPIVGNVIMTFAFFSDTEIEIKTCFVIIAALLTAYNGIIGSLLGCLGQVLSLVSNIFFVVRYHIQKRRQKPADKELTY